MRRRRGVRKIPFTERATSLMLLKGCLKKGFLKVASELTPEHIVGSYDLSPLSDRTLLEVTKAVFTVNKGGTAL